MPPTDQDWRVTEEHSEGDGDVVVEEEGDGLALQSVLDLKDGAIQMGPIYDVRVDILCDDGGDGDDET